MRASLTVAAYSVAAGAFRFGWWELRDRREQLRWLFRTGVRLASTVMIEGSLMLLLLPPAAEKQRCCSGLRLALGVAACGLTYAHNVAGRAPSPTSPVARRGAVLVTGSTAGIGRAAADELSRRGCVVVVPARDVTKAHSVAASIENAFAVDAPLELSDQASVRAYARELRASLARRNMVLTTVVLNAGVMRPTPGSSVDGAELTIASNHLGHHTLATLVLPELEAAADLGYDCRIVVVTSAVHRLAATHHRDLLTDFSPPLRFEMFRAYSRSKLANVLWTEELARRLKNKKISCISLHPGMVATQVTRYLPSLVQIAHTLSMPIMWLLQKTSVLGARTTVHACLSPDLAAPQSTAVYLEDCHPVPVRPQILNERHTPALHHAQAATSLDSVSFGKLARDLWEASAQFAASTSRRNKQEEAMATST